MSKLSKTLKKSCGSFQSHSPLFGRDRFDAFGVGPIINDPESRIFVEQLRAKGMAVASAAGYPMPDGYEGRVNQSGAPCPRRRNSRMAHDLIKGKPTELHLAFGTHA